MKVASYQYLLDGYFSLAVIRSCYLSWGFVVKLFDENFKSFHCLAVHYCQHNVSFSDSCHLHVRLLDHCVHLYNEYKTNIHSLVCVVQFDPPLTENYRSPDLICCSVSTCLLFVELLQIKLFYFYSLLTDSNECQFVSYKMLCVYFCRLVCYVWIMIVQNDGLHFYLIWLTEKRLWVKIFGKTCFDKLFDNFFY